MIILGRPLEPQVQTTRGLILVPCPPSRANILNELTSTTSFALVAKWHLRCLNDHPRILEPAASPLFAESSAWLHFLRFTFQGAKGMIGSTGFQMSTCMAPGIKMLPTFINAGA